MASSLFQLSALLIISSKLKIQFNFFLSKEFFSIKKKSIRNEIIVIQQSGAGVLTESMNLFHFTASVSPDFFSTILCVFQTLVTLRQLT